MNSQQIKYLLTLAQERSFSKAATALYITQPSLSRFVISLEEQLDTKLFDRTTAPLTLTPEGKVVLEACQQIHDIEQDMYAQLAKIKESPQAQICFGTVPMRARSLARSISKYCRENQDIKVEVSEYYMQELKSKLKKGELDFIIGAGPLPDFDFDFEVIANEKIYFIAPPENDAGHKNDPRLCNFEDVWNETNGPCVDLSEFRDFPVIGYAPNTKIHQAILQAYRGQGLTPNFSVNIRSYEIALSMVYEGNGVSVCCATALKSMPYIDKIRCYRLNIPEWPICVFTRKSHPLDDTSRTFIGSLKQDKFYFKS